MKYRIAFGALALTMLAAASGLADPALKSGLPVGSTKISPFNPLHCNGPQSGTKACLV